MELSQFIKQALPIIGQQAEFSVVFFQGAACSHSFFMQLFDRVQSTLSLDIKTLDMQAGDFSWKSQLETSFLGMKCVYWLGDISALKTKQKDDLMKYLATYQGFHTILAFVDAKTEITKSKHTLVITMKDKYFLDDAKMLWVTPDLQQAQKSIYFLHQLYKIKTSYTLDELCLLQDYQDVITADCQEFYATWVTRLVVPDSSLYTLSQLLFEKKQEAFFKLWLQMQSLYSEMFWISFWSDQLYRAYFFIAFTQQENFAGAKQVSFGLSFSFMKQTYKQYQLTELQKFHEAVFAVDSALKHGGNLYQIDQLYIDFFMNKFKN